MKKRNKNEKLWPELFILIEDMQKIRDEKFRRGEDGDMIFVKR